MRRRRVNSNSCAALAPCTVVRSPVRVNTKMCRLEFTATPATSPSRIPAGIFSRSAVASNLISGTGCWACALAAASGRSRQKAVERIIDGVLEARETRRPAKVTICRCAALAILDAAGAGCKGGWNLAVVYRGSTRSVSTGGCNVRQHSDAP